MKKRNIAKGHYSNYKKIIQMSKNIFCISIVFIIFLSLIITPCYVAGITQAPSPPDGGGGVDPFGDPGDPGGTNGPGDIPPIGEPDGNVSNDIPPQVNGADLPPPDDNLSGERDDGLNPPIAYIDSITPNPAVKGEAISFRGHGEATDGEIISWEWRSDIDGQLSTKKSFDSSSLSGGIHIIHFRVKDNNGEWSRGDVTTLIINVLPVADAGETPYFDWVNEPIMFDGSGSHDPDGTIDKYEWDFGDGTVKTGKIIEHAYLRAGIYNVTLTVTDNYGGINCTTTTATIVCIYPIANASGPYFGYINESIIFDGSNSSDVDGTIISYSWDFGDGTNGIGISPVHSYTKNGTFVVTLTVTDDHYGTDTDTTYVIISSTNNCPNKPKVNVIVSEDNNNTFIFIVNSTDPDNDTLRYIFNWGDGGNTSSPFLSNGTAISVRHTWILPGTYNIQVYAQDEHNATSDTTELNVTVYDNYIGSPDNEDFWDLFFGQTDEKTSSSNEDESENNSVIIIGIILILIVTILLVILFFKKIFYKKEYF